MIAEYCFIKFFRKANDEFDVIKISKFLIIFDNWIKDGLLELDINIDKMSKKFEYNFTSEN
jgi:hypothetical protein